MRGCGGRETGNIQPTASRETGNIQPTVTEHPLTQRSLRALHPTRALSFLTAATTAGARLERWNLPGAAAASSDEVRIKTTSREPGESPRHSAAPRAEHDALDASPRVPDNLHSSSYNFTFLLPILQWRRTTSASSPSNSGKTSAASPKAHLHTSPRGGLL